MRDALRLIKLGCGGRNPALPALGSVRVTGNGDCITLQSYDFETAVTVALPCAPGPTFETAYAPLSALTAALKGRKGAVTIGRTESDAVTVGPVTLPTADRGGTRAADDAPALPVIPPEQWNGAARLPDLSGVILAAGRDDTLPTLTGISLELRSGVADRISPVIVAAATDRYRLHWTTDNAGPLTRSALVPWRVLDTVGRAARGHSLTVALPHDTAGVRHAVIRVAPGKRYQNGATIISRTLDGTFPQWRALVPSEHLSTVDCDRDELLTAIQSAAVVLERHRPVVLEPGPDGFLTVAADNGEGSEGSASVAVRATVTGDPVRVAFTPAYLADAVTAAASKGAPVRLSFREPTRPAVATGDTGTAALVMPVRLFD
jgi:DNA polymerase-3 subunit beta